MGVFLLACLFMGDGVGGITQLTYRDTIVWAKSRFSIQQNAHY